MDANLTLNQDVRYTNDGITLNFSRFNNPFVGTISLRVTNLKKYVYYTMDVFIDDVFVASSLPLVGKGDNNYCFEFRRPFEHNDCDVVAKFKVVNRDYIEIGAVKDATGAVVL